MGEKVHLKDVVKHYPLSRCAVCDSHEYILPFPITHEITNYLTGFGELKYPVPKISLIKISNSHIGLNSKLGTNKIRIKFKKDPKKRELFEIQLAAYISKHMDVSVITNGLLS